MRPSVLVLAVVLALTGTSAAQRAPKNRKAAAAALFEKGIKDMQAGKTEQGCAELAESVATLPDSGSKGALAECDTALGRLSEAWELWQDLAQSAPTAELRDDAANNARTLERRLARVTLKISGTAPPDLAVTLNGKPVSLRDAAEHRVDPGTLVVVATSEEIEPWTRTVRVQEGAALEIAIPVVASAQASRRRRVGRVAGLSLAGAGAVVLATGLIFGTTAYLDGRSASDRCGGDTDHCPTAGFASAQQELDSARSAARISTWTTGIGAAALVSGILVYLAFRDPAPTAESSGGWRAQVLASPQTMGIVLSRSLP
ncbi:MAG TPA: hypothetical protein VFK02_26735 [Kofleriaceae bacterium]|nr:hypothetical protein [Kofleriaceae bacterium]